MTQRKGDFPPRKALKALGLLNGENNLHERVEARGASPGLVALKMEGFMEIMNNL